MTIFVQTAEGLFVSTAKIHSFEEEKWAQGLPRTWKILDEAGDCLGTTGEPWNFNPEMLSRMIIPAAPASEVVVVSVSRHAGRPSEEDVYVERLPVLAWCVDSAAPQPVARPISVRVLNGAVLIPGPNGQLFELDGSTFADLNEATRIILGREQGRYETARRAAAQGGAGTIG